MAGGVGEQEGHHLGDVAGVGEAAERDADPVRVGVAARVPASPVSSSGQSECSIGVSVDPGSTTLPDAAPVTRATNTGGGTSARRGASEGRASMQRTLRQACLT